MYTLYGAKGTGSAIAEVAFEVAGVPYERVDLDYEADTGWTSRTLAGMNPLGQVPTVRRPDGGVMTESAAIVLHLADLAPGCGLAPRPDDPRRPDFLRWLVWLVAAVYPTFTYGDRPERFVGGDVEAGKKLRAGTDDHRKDLLRFAEAHAGEPWFLGEWSAVDVYVWAMSHWRPGRAWVAAECPKLAAITARMAEHEVGKRVGARHGYR